MERTKNYLSSNERSLLTLASALVERAKLSASLGQQQYGGDRDIYQALGYKTDILYTDYAGRYLRQDIAKAVIDRPAKATWQGELGVQESKDENDTDFEKEWIQLNKELKLQNMFSRVDRLAGIGCYGVLLLGLDDVKKKEDWMKPVTKGARKLIYVKPLGEDSAKISEYEKEPSNPRYGYPTVYEIKISQPTSTTVSETVQVHYTRVIHVVDDVLENEVIGIPRLEAIFNRLMDLEKLVGGDAEMFWRGARPGYQGVVDKDYSMTTDAKEDLKEQIDEFEHNLRRLLVNEGIEYKALAQQIAEPNTHVDIQIQMISAVTGIPKRILTGSERGELASGQDADEWKIFIQNRRGDHAEVHIVRPFIDKMIEIGVLTKPSTGEYQIIWSDLFAASEKELADVGRARSEALRNYTTSPMAEAVIPPTAFMEFFLGFKPHQIDLIKEIVGSEIDAELIASLAEAQVAQSAKPENKSKKIGIKQPVRTK